MNLVIVESPTKARKLRDYLGKQYHVEASVGHIRDLPKKTMGIDTENNFEPSYEISEDKKKVISALKKAAKGATVIYLATDPDREGEAIAWHITYALSNDKKPDMSLYKRATFHEITKAAVQKAIDTPGEIKMDLVHAQQARRVVDRLVGYEVSPVLWKKVRRGLSAGRVQSVAVRLIVEREREIEAFKPDEYWEIAVAISTQAGTKIKEAFAKDAQLPESAFIAAVVQKNGKSYEPKKEKDVTPVVESLPTADYVVAELEKKERRRQSLPPFTTSTLQQASANAYGYSSKQTMRLAQQLYEEGLITYHRTDSVNLSKDSISMARTYIKSEYGAEYVPDQPRIFASSSKNAQEAHEAIRVTDARLTADQIGAKSKSLDEKNAKLYELIWRRFLASQMPPAVYDQTTIHLLATPKKATAALKTIGLRSTGSVLKFPGWMKLFKPSQDVVMPQVEKDQPMHFVDLDAQQKFTQPPPRYNDASLVKELEKRGIGRPSTYASIISVIEDRGYVERDAKRFVATPVGMTVSDFLLEHFPVFMEYEFTAEMEEDLDRISRGEKQWQKVVKEFYKPFHAKVEKADDAERTQIPVEKTGEVCPECGETEKGEIVIRSGKFGKFKSCSRYPECKFTENIVDVIEGVKCPLCQKGDVISRNTRWGKKFFGCSTYPTCDWASWKQPEPGEKLTKTEWAEMQKARKERSEKRKKAFEARKKKQTK
ncbi:MAG: type I DNA topoisomerase [Patescibacteria group bacterium]